jgi:hypothetical protein
LLQTLTVSLVVHILYKVIQEGLAQNEELRGKLLVLNQEGLGQTQELLGKIAGAKSGRAGGNTGFVRENAGEKSISTCYSGMDSGIWLS